MSYIGIHITNISHTTWRIELQEILNLFIHFLHQFRTLNTSISLARLGSKWEVCRFNSKTQKQSVSKTHRTLKGLNMIWSAFAWHEHIFAFRNVFSHLKVVVYRSIYDQLQGLHMVVIVTYEYHAYIFDVRRFSCLRRPLKFEITVLWENCFFADHSRLSERIVKKTNMTMFWRYWRYLAL